MSAHKEHKLGIEVFNKGRRSLTIVASGFRLDTQSDENTATAFDDALPKELAEGQKHITYVNPTDIETHKILYAWVRDATGRTYYSKKRPFKAKSPTSSL
jgi:hypothetical protein